MGFLNRKISAGLNFRAVSFVVCTAMMSAAPVAMAATKAPGSKRFAESSANEPAGTSKTAEQGKPTSSPRQYKPDYNDFNQSNAGFDLNLAASPSPFEDIIDITEFGANFGATIFRVGRPTGLINYNVASLDAETKYGAIKIKQPFESSGYSLGYFMPVGSGFRLGASYSGNDYTFKQSTDNYKSKLDYSDTAMSLHFGAALKSGFGLGMSFISKDSSLKYDPAEIDEESDQFGYIVPEFYFASGSGEYKLRIINRRSHESEGTPKTYSFNMEQSVSDAINVLAGLNRNFWGEYADGRKDNYGLSAGLRGFIEKRSNILIRVNFDDVSYKSSEDASLSTIAMMSLDSQLNYWLTPQHSVSAHVAYMAGNGKGRVLSEKSKITAKGMLYGVGLGVRF